MIKKFVIANLIEQIAEKVSCDKKRIFERLRGAEKQKRKEKFQRGTFECPFMELSKFRELKFHHVLD